MEATVTETLVFEHHKVKNTNWLAIFILSPDWVRDLNRVK